MMQATIIGNDEVEALINDLLELYGYDFTNYTRASLKRRLNRLFIIDRFPSFAEFRYKIKYDASYLNRVVESITVNVTEMFRDPFFFKTLRSHVLPNLATYPFIRIWLAGCSTGEEVYSIAILLEEAGLLQKSLVYATDLNTEVLERAKRGIFLLSQMKQYSENYIFSGGTRDFSSYYTAYYDRVKFNENLIQKVIFSNHNLVTDHSFNEFQLIFCRNVLIYFNKELQDKVINLFDLSLDALGYLALGSKETIRFFSIAKNYKQVDAKEKIWRKLN